MHRSHLPLRTWFPAAHPMATHSNGISALQLQAQPGIGSYRSAWLPLQKLRRAMVDPDRSPLQGIAEVDGASMPCRDGGGAEDGGERGVAGRGRGAAGRIPIAGAVELSEDGSPRRIRLETVGDYGAEALHGFIAGAVAPGAWAVTDGWSGYIGLPDNPRERRVAGRPPHPPDVRAKRADVAAGPERPPQEPVGQELPDPLAARHVAPAPRDPPPHPRRTRREDSHSAIPGRFPATPPNGRTGSGNRSGPTARWWTSLPMPVPAQSRFTVPGFPAFPLPFRPRGIPAPPPFHRPVRAGRSHGAFPIPWTGSRRSRAISDRRRSRFEPRP